MTGWMKYFANEIMEAWGGTGWLHRADKAFFWSGIAASIMMFASIVAFKVMIG